MLACFHFFPHENCHLGVNVPTFRCHASKPFSHRPVKSPIFTGESQHLNASKDRVLEYYPKIATLIGKMMRKTIGCTGFLSPMFRQTNPRLGSTLKFRWHTCIHSCPSILEFAPIYTFICINICLYALCISYSCVFYTCTYNIYYLSLCVYTHTLKY